MIGISLRTNILHEKNMTSTEKMLLHHYNGINGFLDYLKNKNVSYIELREFANEEPRAILDIINPLWKSGFKISIHGKLVNQISFMKYYNNFLYLFSESQKYQNSILIVLHALSSDDYNANENAVITSTTLSKWCKEIDNRLPIKFALELNRCKGKNDPSTNFTNLIHMTRNLPKSRVGLCWDFGHYYYNMLFNNSVVNTPSQLCLNTVVHTHIHALNDARKTHYVFTNKSKLPLSTYISLLQNLNYNGVYNLELSLNRIPESEIIRGLDYSLDLLSETIDNAKNA